MRDGAEERADLEIRLKRNAIENHLFFERQKNKQRLIREIEKKEIALSG